MASSLSMAADCGPTAEEHVRNIPGPFGTGTGVYQAREDAHGKPGNKQRTNGTPQINVWHTTDNLPDLGGAHNLPPR
ncbi:unnamed protein product [Ectocarpus sp. CCAP 1310/34]|nr:unnamed protein product [Ectocarpus sp. CCAP 1310/34]